MMLPDPNGITRSIPPNASPPDENGITRTVVPDGDPQATKTVHGNFVGMTHTPGQVPGYEILSELGRGGMGVVYLARQQGLNRAVALKMVLSGGHASATERVRFLAEAEAVASVQHPGIVQVFDFGTHAGQPYFAMEYCPGGSLGAKLDGTPMAARDAAAVVIKIARAVQAAHDKAIIHRDLKPSNILLAADGTPKVTDFGLARKSDSGSGLTQTGAVLGSPSYMSPEQAEGKHDKIGVASDVYSVGAILYECLTGRPPFRAATPLDTVMQVIKDEPVPPSRLAAKIPRDLDTIALKCLEKDASKRYATATALAEDLQRHLNNEPIVARPATLLEKYWKSVRRRPLLNALFLVTAISIGASIGILNTTNRNLRHKQDLLEQETEAARAAKADADVQRQLATARLEKAVEAVDRVMVRVAGEKWATRPELQKDRREVLEEAVAFFQSLGSSESKDPIVRRQAARANLYTASAYMSLGEYDTCETSTQTALDLYKSLSEEFPHESQYIRGQAASLTLSGHSDAIRSKFQSAIVKYQEVVVLAKKAQDLEPNEEENTIILADGHSSLALFYSYQRPDLARENHLIAYAIGEKLCAKPAPSFHARLVYTTAAVNLAVRDINDKNLNEADAKLMSCMKQLAILEKMKPPSSRLAEQYTTVYSGYLVYRGLLEFRRKKFDLASSQTKAGIALLESLIAIQPNSFPLRMQQVQHKISYVIMLIAQKDWKTAKKILDEVQVEKELIVNKQPQLNWVKGMGQNELAQLIIERVRSQYYAGFVDDADLILENSKSGYVAVGPVIYNIACIYAQATVTAPEADKERFAKKAVALLHDVNKRSNYMKEHSNITHMDNDSDFDPIRNRPDFQEFMKLLKEETKYIEPAKKE